MYTILLSGGSGKRLWPLSNDKRSKQFVRLLTDENGKTVSMVQRMWSQLERAGLASGAVICTGKGQLEIINSQLGNVHVALEPYRRDTFPAVALSCLYAKEFLGASDEDVVCILPVDPYTDRSYFDTAARLEDYLNQSGADIALMGAIPKEPSSKYGYILPGSRHNGYMSVRSFQEKPGKEDAAALLEEGALWNCGVFCFRISRIMDALSKYGHFDSYQSLYENYERLPKISFDYEVLEQAKNLIVVPFAGVWKDLGTWNAIAEMMTISTMGDVFLKGCEGTVVVNELNIPVVAMGLKDLVVVAAMDGILVCERSASEGLKEVISAIDRPPMYEERRWGTLQTLDITDGDYTKRIRIFEGMNSSLHYHRLRDEIWVILSGMGKLILEDNLISLKPGSTVRIAKGQQHIVKAVTDLEFLEIHLGEEQDDDIYRSGFDFEKELRRISGL